ncbi:hypothetical protein BCR34DRAFT_586553 [Clohesyomyces aquaticus]|uniref:Uncharacterized protein n=1 Tax=Clohesyomyces aquaticus TaxID=1231657 RepID=A0A1Y1ZT55_9PLEO|nr:hypothetical protein BCR34DRAFT_586553 [Clohesyomyces aquaticus]
MLYGKKTAPEDIGMPFSDLLEFDGNATPSSRQAPSIQVGLRYSGNLLKFIEVLRYQAKPNEDFPGPSFRPVRTELRQLAADEFDLRPSRKISNPIVPKAMMIVDTIGPTALWVSLERLPSSLKRDDTTDQTVHVFLRLSAPLELAQNCISQKRLEVIPTQIAIAGYSKAHLTSVPACREPANAFEHNKANKRLEAKIVSQ